MPSFGPQGRVVSEGRGAHLGAQAAVPALTWALARDLDEVTIIRKPHYLLYRS